MSHEQDNSGAPEPAAASKAPRGRAGWSLLSSAVIHLAAFVIVLQLLRVAVPLWLKGGESSTVVYVAQVEPPIELLEEIIEPPPEIVEPQPEPHPELVESRFVPLFPMPPDPLPPEPIDWLPPEDLFSDLPDFKRSPARAEVAPPPEPEAPQLPAQERAEPLTSATPPILEEGDLPQVLESPTPHYPRQAVRMRWEGTALLRIWVAADGTVIHVVVQRSSGHKLLDESALEAFGRWKFQACTAGEPEVRILQKPFTFRIE